VTAGDDGVLAMEGDQEGRSSVVGADDLDGWGKVGR
jgi:hypothetical protein